MGRISIDNLQPGMILDEDALAGGNTLLTAGSTLSAKHIDILRSWGVMDAEIKGISNADIGAGEMEQFDIEMVKIFEDQLRPLYALNDEKDAFISELLRVSTLYNIEKSKNE